MVLEMFGAYAFFAPEKSLAAGVILSPGTPLGIVNPIGPPITRNPIGTGPGTPTTPAPPATVSPNDNSQEGRVLKFLESSPEYIRFFVIIWSCPWIRLFVAGNKNAR